jgi:hypothetical protein
MADDGSQQHKPDFSTAVQDAKALATVLVMEAESILGRRTARVLGVLVLFAVVVGILHWYIAPSGAEQKQALVVTLAQILAGTALLSGLYFTWRTLQVNREGQLTERFTRAIDQLGATDDKTGEPRLELRLGGIYALERIDKESPERAYHRTVVEVLTAYIREDSRQDRGESSRPTLASNEDAEQDKGVERDAEPTLRRPPADIQAILDVLNRREEDRVPKKHHVHHLELQGANLEGAYLQGADLEGARLEGANLQGAGLEGAHLEDARLQGANLQGAHLQAAHLQGARLQGADLEGARLQVANLRKADLREARYLVQEQIEKANGDETTQLPTYLKRPAHWNVKTDEQTQRE